MLRELSRLTGLGQIPHLIADHNYAGGGLNLLRKGGYLRIHVDGNWHDDRGVHRRLNLVLYLNGAWRPELGGARGFYDEAATKVIGEYAPSGKRLVVFETHDKSFHRHTTLIDCPDDQFRSSLILYYCTAARRPDGQVTVEQPHSALWRSKGWMDKRGNRMRS